ncbi:MAG: ABC transporter substrate-binding protein [Clostridiaceae bacterium]|nr:ABC transporter substrate-binding protein [Clostridiaceae bacterium]
MKKLLITGLLIIALILTSCSNQNAKTNPLPDNAGTENTNIQEPTDKDSSDKSAAPSGEEFTIGILPAESAIPIILAKEKGFFDEAGVKVKIQSFSSPNDRNVAVQAKELDAAIADVMTVASFMQNGIEMVITSDISEDFKILSSPASGITEMSGLAGKKVSLVRNFILEYIMDQFAAKYGFTYEIVEIPSFSGRAEALLSNQIDGVVYTEPQAGMLVKQGAHLIGSSKEAGIKGGTLLFTKEMIQNKPNDIAAFYKAYNKAIDYMNATEASEYSSILTEYQFPEAITAYLSGIKGDFQFADKISKDQFDNIIAWTLENGLISKAFTYEELTDFSFINK